MYKRIMTLLCMLTGLALLMSVNPVSAQSNSGDDRVQQVHMVVWRGCEAACLGFIRYFEDRDLPVNVTVTDVSRDKTQLPIIQKQLIEERPDLVVTWGTSVSRGILGTITEFGSASALGDIPAVFMIVADPVGSQLVESYDASGRPMISGVRNRVPEKVQLNLLFEYYRPNKMGVLNSPSELNSALNTESLRAIADEFSFELIEHLYTPDENGEIDPSQIPTALAELKRLGADAVYVGSSSFNLENQSAFVDAATALNLPVFSAYAQMVKDAGALMAVGTSYSNVGRLAAVQAERVVLGGIEPGDLEVKSLNRYSVILNMGSARKLSLYPPLSLLTVAEIVQ
jgi:putative ABC transport system substrate-binding protein